MKDSPTSGLSRLEEQRIILSVRQGEDHGARALVDHYKQRLFSFLWRVVANHSDVEDLCQETFLRAISSIKSYDSTYRFSTWLFTIGYRLALNHIRRQGHMTTRTELDFDQLRDRDGSHPAEVAESREAARLRSKVWDAVDQLSPAQKTAVLLFYREEMSCQDLAKVMDVPVATVKSHLHRARAKLRELLEPVFAGDWQKLCILSEEVG